MLDDDSGDGGSRLQYRERVWTEIVPDTTVPGTVPYTPEADRRVDARIIGAPYFLRHSTVVARGDIAI
jgi:hypothetical protein